MQVASELVVKPNWWSPRAVSLHVTAVVVVGGCVAMCWWQVTRALGGNDLSWAYVFEWPFFGGYAVFVWWRLVHEQPGELDHPRHRLNVGVPRQATAGPPPRSADGGPTNQGPTNQGPNNQGPTIAAVSHTAGPTSDDPDADDPDAEEREAYNRYLAELDAHGRRSRW